jgi:integrase
VAELHAKYEPWYKSNHPRSWVSAFRPRWRNLLPHFGEMRAAEITLAHTDEYRLARAEAAPETRNCELSGLRAAFGWAVKRKLLPSNPLAGLEREPAQNARTAFLDETAFARLAAAAPCPMARALFVVAYDTGMRRGELLNLKRSEVDLEQRLVRLGDADVKNGCGRIVPLTDRAVDAIRELPTWAAYVFSFSGRPLRRTTVHNWFVHAREKSGVRADMTFHGLRHSAATMMRRRGVPWTLIKTALGWKSEAAARRYQQFSADDWTSLRERMNAGIASEGRRPPLRAVEKPEIHEQASVLTVVTTVTK